MEVLAPVCWDRGGGHIDQDNEAQVKRHAVSCCVVYWEADEKEDGGVDGDVEMSADPGRPELGTWHWQRDLGREGRVLDCQRLIFVVGSSKRAVRRRKEVVSRVLRGGRRRNGVEG